MESDEEINLPAHDYQSAPENNHDYGGEDTKHEVFDAPQSPESPQEAAEEQDLQNEQEKHNYSREGEQDLADDDNDDGDFRPAVKRSRVAVLDDDDDEEEPTTRPKHNEVGGEENEGVDQEAAEAETGQHEQDGEEAVENENEEGAEAGEIVEDNDNDNVDDDQDRDGDAQRGAGGDMNLEMIIERAAAERARRARRTRRGKKDVEFINDADENIQRLVARMKMAADNDRRANETGKVATAKLRLLDDVRAQLLRKELHSFMVENGMLHALTEWLAPLPDRSLPCLSVRETLLRSLSDFPIPNPDNLKSSGLGKAVMYLRKHPKESKENKERAAKLIHEWSRQIFNLQNDYRELTRDEREKRDGRVPGSARGDDDDVDEDELPRGPSGAPPRRMLNAHSLPILGAGTSSKRDSGAGEAKREPKPGEVGFVPRARVPMPSYKDYVVRPKSNAELVTQNSPKKQHQPSGIERQLRSLREAKMRSRNKVQSAVELKIQGSKLV